MSSRRRTHRPYERKVLSILIAWLVANNVPPIYLFLGWSSRGQTEWSKVTKAKGSECIVSFCLYPRKQVNKGFYKSYSAVWRTETIYLLYLCIWFLSSRSRLSCLHDCIHLIIILLYQYSQRDLWAANKLRLVISCWLSNQQHSLLGRSRNGREKRNRKICLYGSEGRDHMLKRKRSNLNLNLIKPVLLLILLLFIHRACLL